MIDKDLLKLIGKNKKYLVLAVILMVLGLVGNLLITGSICYAVYLYMNYETINLYFLYTLLVFVLGVVVRYVTSVYVERVKDKLGREVKKDLRAKAYDKILRLGLRSSKDLSSSGLTQTTMEGIEQLDTYYTSYIPQFFYAMLAPIILFCVTVGIEWRVALVLICCVPLIPLSIIGVSKYAKRIFAKYWGKYISMGDTFLDAVQGLKDLKIYNADKYYHQIVNEKSEDFRKVTMKVLVMQLASSTIMDLVAYGGSALGIVLSLLSVRYWELSIPAALFLILVAVEFFLPLRKFGSAFHVAMNGASAGKKLIALLNEPEPEWGKEEVKDLDVKLEHVHFSYNDDRDNKEVLKDINIEFPTKGVIGIVGESGSGKSTIANLVLGGLRPTEGKLLIGGKEIKEYSRESYYSHIGLVSYDSYIFNESIKDNFRVAKNDVTDEEIYESLKKVNLYDFVINNGGLDKVVLEGSVNISGGQRQRLALAINLVTDKDIYIFDEATSNIDLESEEIIMNNIFEMSKSKLIILITHRLENVRKADYIYYLEGGVILEQGNFVDLMKVDGRFASLYNTQKDLEEGYKDSSVLDSSMEAKAI